MDNQQYFDQIADYAKAKGLTRAEWHSKLALLYIAIGQLLSTEKKTLTGGNQ